MPSVNFAQELGQISLAWRMALLPGVDLSFDQIQYTNFPVVVLNLNTPSALLGFRLGGIVGHRFLSRYRVTIDLENSVLGLRQIT